MFFTTKICIRCGIEKPFNEFYRAKSRKDGLTSCCKSCNNADNRKYRLDHPEKIKANNLKWREANPERKKLTDKKWREANPERKKLNDKKWCEANPERKKLNDKKWCEANPERKKLNDKKWCASHPELVRLNRQRADKKRGRLITTKLGKTISSGMSHSVKDKDYRPWEDVVGYTVLQLMLHLESKFLPGMSWDNYGFGKDKWNIDHIICKTFFQFKSVKDVEFQYCWSLNNLQPLWQHDNILKYNKLPQEWETFKLAHPEKLYKYVAKAA